MIANFFKKFILLEAKRKLKITKKQYFQQHKEDVNESHKKYVRNRIEADVSFRLIVCTGNRIYKSLKGMIKQPSSKDVFGVDIDTYTKWTEYQMTAKMNWLNLEIDHVKPNCLFDVFNDKKLREAFNWKNTQPLLKQDHQHEGMIFNLLDYQLQFIRAYRFMKLNAQDG